MLHMRVLLVSLFTLLTFCSLSLADDKEPVQLEEVVVTASRYPTTQQDAPAKVTVVDRKAIAASGATNVDDLLRNVAGVDIVRSSGLTSSTSNVTLRGFGGQARGRTLVLMDGVPMNENYSGEVYWNAIPLQNVDRIEIVHGAASGLYGPGAMGGVINIITKQPTKLSNEVALTYGSFNTASAHISHANKIGPWSYLLSGDGFQTDGYLAAPNPQVYDIRRTKEDYNGDLKLNYDISDTATVGIGYRHYSEDVNGGRQYYYGSNKIDELRFNASRYGNILDLKGNMYFNWNESSWTNDKYTAALATRYTSIDYVTTSPKRGWGGNLQALTRLSGKQTFALGTDWRLGQIESRDDYQSMVRNVSVQGKQDAAGFYLNYEAKPIEPLIINLVGRYDYWRTYDGSLQDTSLSPQQTIYGNRTDNAVSPQGSLVYHMTKEATFRLSAGRSFRVPTLYDLYRTWTSSTTLYKSNADLSPEEAWSYEVGMDYAMTSKLKARVAFYYSDVSNLIYSMDTGLKSGGLAVKQKQNVAKVEIQGAETELRYNLLKEWSFSANYTYNSSRIKEHTDKTLEGNYLTYTPRDKLSLGTSFRDPRFINVDIVARYLGTFYNDDKNTQVMGHDFIWDVNLSREVLKGLDLSLNVQNLFDRTYQAYYGTLAPPLTVMGTIKWGF